MGEPRRRDEIIDRYLADVLTSDAHDTILIGPANKLPPPLSGWAFLVVGGSHRNADAKTSGRYLSYHTREAVELVREAMVVRILELDREGLSLHVFRESPNLISFASMLWPRDFGALRDGIEQIMTQH